MLNEFDKYYIPITRYCPKCHSCRLHWVHRDINKVPEEERTKARCRDCGFISYNENIWVLGVVIKETWIPMFHWQDIIA